MVRFTKTVDELKQVFTKEVTIKSRVGLHYNPIEEYEQTEFAFFHVEKYITGSKRVTSKEFTKMFDKIIDTADIESIEELVDVPCKGGTIIIYPRRDQAIVFGISEWTDKFKKTGIIETIGIMVPSLEWMADYSKSPQTMQAERDNIERILQARLNVCIDELADITQDKPSTPLTSMQKINNYFKSL